MVATKMIICFSILGNSVTRQLASTVVLFQNDAEALVNTQKMHWVSMKANLAISQGLPWPYLRATTQWSQHKRRGRASGLRVAAVATEMGKPACKAIATDPRLR